jgi:hypothetical protein
MSCCAGSGCCCCAIGSKVAAAFSRAEARDFLDLDAIRESGLYSDDAILALAHEHDPGFDTLIFAGQLSYVGQLDERDTVAYGVDAATLERTKQRLLSWADELGDA